MPWYDALNAKLTPLQPLVILGLAVIVGLSVYFILKGDKVARTAFFVYLISP